jgi:hypothetical protein
MAGRRRWGWRLLRKRSSCRSSSGDNVNTAPACRVRWRAQGHSIGIAAGARVGALQRGILPKAGALVWLGTRQSFMAALDADGCASPGRAPSHAQPGRLVLDRCGRRTGAGHRECRRWARVGGGLRERSGCRMILVKPLEEFAARGRAKGLVAGIVLPAAVVGGAHGAGHIAIALGRRRWVRGNKVAGPRAWSVHFSFWVRRRVGGWVGGCRRREGTRGRRAQPRGVCGGGSTKRVETSTARAVLFKVLARQ